MLSIGWKSALLVLIVTVFVASCSTLPKPFDPPPPGAHSTAIFYSRWVGYLDQFGSDELQIGCRPVLIEPRADVQYRGTVALLHDYSACPQQFFDLTELLALRGYRSMLVLLPGHGEVQVGTARVNLLPKGRDWRQQYDAFADTINGIMNYAAGERVIGGNSAGAAASLVVNSRAPSLYDRHIAWVPHFRSADATPRDGTDSQTRAEEQAAKINACLDRRSRGRAGYCGISAAASEVTNLLGQEAFQILADGSISANLQIVASEEDAVISNRDIVELAKTADAERFFACMYPPGVPHSMVSQFENPDVDMFWLDSLLNGTIGFIADGYPFPIQLGGGAKESSIDECALLTERTD